MKKIYICLILVFFIFSIGAISAEDLDTSDSVISTEMDAVDSVSVEEENEIQTDPVDTPTDKSLNDLYGNLSTAENEFNFTDNYAYNPDTDSDLKEGIPLGNIVINGNDHYIDFKGIGNGFKIKDVSNVVINNLTFINSNVTSLSIKGITNVTLNNVHFIDKDNYPDPGRGIVILVCPTTTLENLMKTEFTANNCSFYSDSEIGYGIYSSGINVNVYNTLFSASAPSEGCIHISNAFLSTNNTVFNNLSSDYSPAIYAETYKMLLNNTQFTNTNADMTAGAVGIKLTPFFENIIPSFIIENCLFENLSCSNDGGALYFDSIGAHYLRVEGTMEIINSVFNNCSSDFGGAILQLAGNLTLKNCNFTNNYAEYEGGAVYTSISNLNIINCNFINNSAGIEAGALYYDEGDLKIINSNFTGNYLKKVSSDDLANTIYTYTGNVYVENSIFNNEGLSIRGVFSNFTGLDTSDKISINETDYEYYRNNPSILLVLLNNTIDVETLPVKFDLRDWEWVSPVEDQGQNGACWTFGNIAALESNLRKATGLNITFSENNMQDMKLMYSKYGAYGVVEGGSTVYAISYLISWLGTYGQDDDPYDSLGKVSKVFHYSNCSVHVQDVILILNTSANVTKDIKDAVLKYGGVNILYCSAGGLAPYYNPDTNAFYGPEFDSDGKLRTANHAVCIVGWDDNYSKNNFNITPPGDGAWIVKNSWGEYFGDGGYFYLSYYDTSILRSPESSSLAAPAIAYIFENNISYITNYQTDYGGIELFNKNFTFYSNKYTVEFDELLAAVGTYFNESGVEYELKVYVNDKLVHTQSGISDFMGFKTIKLNKYIPVKSKDTLLLQFKSNSVPFIENTRLRFIDGGSLISSDGINWETISNRSISLKAYTVVDDSIITDNKNIAVDYDGGSYFSVKIVTADGITVGEGAKVTFKINGKTSTVKTDSNGIAKLKITDIPKKYAITTTYNGKSVNNYVTVKQVLTSSKVTVKKTAKKFNLKATLKINGKLVKGKAIKFKLNGKTYTVKTNAKGVAQKTLNQNVIKKLKKGKTYTVQVSYKQDTIKTTLKVM